MAQVFDISFVLKDSEPKNIFIKIRISLSKILNIRFISTEIRFLTHLVSNPTMKTTKMEGEKEQMKRTLARKQGWKSNQKEMLGSYQYIWPDFQPERS